MLLMKFVQHGLVSSLKHIILIGMEEQHIFGFVTTSYKLKHLIIGGGFMTSEIFVVNQIMLNIIHFNSEFHFIVYQL